MEHNLFSAGGLFLIQTFFEKDTSLMMQLFIWLRYKHAPLTPEGKNVSPAAILDILGGYLFVKGGESNLSSLPDLNRKRFIVDFLTLI